MGGKTAEEAALLARNEHKVVKEGGIGKKRYNSRICDAEHRNASFKPHVAQYFFH